MENKQEPSRLLREHRVEYNVPHINAGTDSYEEKKWQVT